MKPFGLNDEYGFRIDDLTGGLPDSVREARFVFTLYLFQSLADQRILPEPEEILKSAVIPSVIRPNAIVNKLRQLRV